MLNLARPTWATGRVSSFCELALEPDPVHGDLSGPVDDQPLVEPALLFVHPGPRHHRPELFLAEEVHLGAVTTGVEVLGKVSVVLEAELREIKPEAQVDHGERFPAIPSTLST